jgi:glycosyltransferase involved in cell wall biosynthesis
MTDEVRARAHSDLFDRSLPRLNRAAPVLFTDPLEVLLHRLKRTDVIVCHDMGPVTHAQFYAPGVSAIYHKIFAEISAVRPHLVFVSRSSQREFERAYGSSYASAMVVYPSLRMEIKQGAREPLKGVRPPFLLTVGAVGARKNQAGAIEAFARSGLSRHGWSYVICGGAEPGYERVAQTARETAGVMLTGYASDAELRWLYAQAAGFVLPSHLEGFGIPAAEAAASGLVPLISSGGALQEVIGEGALYADPSDVDAISAAMLELAVMSEEAKGNRLATLQSHIVVFTPAAAKLGWRTAIDNALGSAFQMDNQLHATR